MLYPAKTKLMSLFSMCALGACSMIGGAKATTGGGGTEVGSGDSSGGGLADNMADAKTYHVGDSVDADAGCNASGYMKIDAPAGQAFKINLDIDAPAGACVNLSYMTSTGSTQDPGKMFGDLCVDKGASQSLDVVGVDGGSFIQVLEDPPCKGAKVKIGLQ